MKISFLFLTLILSCSPVLRVSEFRIVQEVTDTVFVVDSSSVKALVGAVGPLIPYDAYVVHSLDSVEFFCPNHKKLYVWNGSYWKLVEGE